MATGFKKYHPWVNVTFFISVIVFGMLFLHPVCLFISFFGALLLDIRLKGRKALKELFGFLLPMLLFVTAINGVFNHYGLTVLYTLENGNNITLEALVYGFVTGLTVLSVMTWFFCMNEIVTADKLMLVMGKGFPRFVLVITMSLRFLPLYRRKLSEISQAQQGIGRSMKQGNFIEKIKNAVHSVSILITWSLENAIETSDSMKARCYGEGKRKLYSKFRFRKSDGISLACILLFDIFVAVSGFSGGMYASYNPYIMINSTKISGTVYLLEGINAVVNPLSAVEIISFVAYFFLCFLPLIIDLKEELNWHRLKSKI